MSEYWIKVMKININVASILSFWIDILLSSKSIGLESKLVRVEADNKIELEKKLRPSYLSVD